MFIVLIPFAVLLAVVFFKKIPFIGGEIRSALVLAAFTALFLGGVYSPIAWGKALIFGLDKIAWVMFLIFLGGIFAELQNELKSVKTVLNILRSAFGRTPKGMIFVIMITLCLAGSLIGDANASCTIIGILGVQILLDMGLSGEQTSATLVMGASIGSIMPPITQALFLSGALMGLTSIEMNQVLNISYFSVGLGLILCCLYVSRWIKIKELPPELMPEKKAWETLKEGWVTLIPLFVLVTIIILESGFGIRLLSVFDPIFAYISHIPILRGIDYRINKALVICIMLTFCYRNLRKKAFSKVGHGIRKTLIATTVLVCAGFMIGAFYNSGMIELVQAGAVKLNEHILKIGGAIAMTLMGMLTGSQSTAQTTIFSTLGPALQAIGLNPVKVSLAGAHLAMAGQGMPPVDLLTFVVAGLVGGFTGIKVNPIKSMFYSSFMCVYFFIVGLIFLYS
jgi:TRAP-type transport system large permease protein